jgi:nitrite reductase (NADH) small subunit
VSKARVCRTDELPDGAVRRFVVEGRAIALARCDGTLHAFADACPHKGGWLSEGQLHTGRRELICPWHRFRFRLDDGASVTNPAMVARRYPVRVEGDEVFIEL